MARGKGSGEITIESEKERLQSAKKELKKEQRQQRREAKRRAKEIAKQEEELGGEEGGYLLTFFATVLIVVIWLAVVCIIIKLDVGGFGSSVLTPLLKDVPVINRILPSTAVTETTDSERYGGYSSLEEAVDQIKSLELQLENALNASSTKDEELNTLKAEVLRLQEFEKAQVEFQRIRSEFYEEVVYAEKGPGAEAYAKYYESMDPTTAEYIYRQVVQQQEESAKVQEYAAAYAQMKPKEAAEIFESMTDNLNLVAKILNVLNSEQRGSIMGVMDPDVAAKLTKIMDPES